MDLPVGEGGHVGIVGDEQDRPAAGMQVAQDGHHLGTAGAVEVAGRLVGQEQGRLGDQGAGDGDALLLPAGQLGRLVGQPVGEPQPLERLAARASRSRRPTPW